jgi:hypothetical protein
MRDEPNFHTGFGHNLQRKKKRDSDAMILAPNDAA